MILFFHTIRCLTSECHTGHTTSNPEEIHVSREDVKGTLIDAGSDLSEVDDQSGLINTGAIHGTVGLPGLGIKRERVDGDTL